MTMMNTGFMHADKTSYTSQLGKADITFSYVKLGGRLIKIGKKIFTAVHVWQFFYTEVIMFVFWNWTIQMYGGILTILTEFSL